MPKKYKILRILLLALFFKFDSRSNILTPKRDKGMC